MIWLWTKIVSKDADNGTVTFDDKGKKFKSTDIIAKSILVSMIDLNEMETKFGH